MIKTFQHTQVPAIGLGTYKLTGDTAYAAVNDALDYGYRHIDTARMYGNEAEIGKALLAHPLSRDELFITSKIWHEDLAPDQMEREVEESLSDLNTDYLDLLLIHWPSSTGVPLGKSLEKLVEIKEAGKTRQIGVSNFTPSLLMQALNLAPIFCIQVEYHPFLGQDQLLSIAEQNDLMLTAYSPLAQGEVFNHDTLTSIGKKYGKSAGQVALRWLLEQRQVCAIPRSGNSEHRKTNFDVTDFSLSREDKDQILGLDKTHRLVDPEFAPDW